jgi:hypothetical protein
VGHRHQPGAGTVARNTWRRTPRMSGRTADQPLPSTQRGADRRALSARNARRVRLSRAGWGRPGTIRGVASNPRRPAERNVLRLSQLIHSAPASARVAGWRGVALDAARPLPDRDHGPIGPDVSLARALRNLRGRITTGSTDSTHRSSLPPVCRRRSRYGRGGGVLMFVRPQRKPIPPAWAGWRRRGRTRPDERQ